MYIYLFKRGNKKEDNLICVWYKIINKLIFNKVMLL